MDAIALTYDPTFDAWVMEVRPIDLNNLKGSSTFLDESPKKTTGSSKRGLRRCWKFIREGLVGCWACQRPNEPRSNKKTATLSRHEYYSQMSVRDRDEKLSEAIVYCNKTTRADSGCCLPRRSHRSSS